MDSNLILYMMIGVGILFAVIVVLYIIMNKKMKNSDIAQIRQLRKGTKTKHLFYRNSISEIIYNVYKNPFLKKDIYLK